MLLDLNNTENELQVDGKLGTINDLKDFNFELIICVISQDWKAFIQESIQMKAIDFDKNENILDEVRRWAT